MDPVFEVGDLVKPTADYKKERKHTSSQCKLGVVIGFKETGSEQLYKVYWWPHGAYFFFPPQYLVLISRAAIDIDNCSLNDLAAELQDKADNI